MLEKTVKFCMTFSDEIIKIAAVFASYCAFRDWTENGSSPAILLALLIIFIIYPILKLVFSVLSIPVMFICAIYLEYKKKGFSDEWEHNKSESAGQEWNDREWNEYWERQKSRSGENYEKYYRQSEQQNNSGQQQNQQQQRQQNYQQSNSSQNEQYRQAMSFYGLKMPFTEQQLREKRRALMKKAHPDVGGSTKEAEKINVYFDVLKRYAA